MKKYMKNHFEFLGIKKPELNSLSKQLIIHSSNFWLQRSAILYQLKYKEKTYTKTLFAIMEACAGSKEFFVRKAIGWALREYSKTDPVAVRSFVHAHTLAPLSEREALKWMGKEAELKISKTLL